MIILWECFNVYMYMMYNATSFLNNENLKKIKVDSEIMILNIFYKILC
jgi:hypothetical protein